MGLLYDVTCANLEHFRRNFLHYLISIIHWKFAQACIERVSSSVYKDMGWSIFLFSPNSQFLFYPNKYFSFSVWLVSLSMIISSCIHDAANATILLFLWLTSIPLHTCSASSLSIHMLMDIEAASMSWLLWLVLQWT